MRVVAGSWVIVVLAACGGQPATPQPTQDATPGAVAAESTPTSSVPSAKVVEALAPAQPTQQSPAASERNVVAPPLPSPTCTVGALAGPPWGAASKLLGALTHRPGFHCPTEYRVVQRRPWYPRATDLLRAPRRSDEGGEIHMITGRNAAAGDSVWAAIVHAPDYKGKDPTVWAAYQYHPTCARGKLMDDWYCLWASSRIAGRADALRSWVEANSDVRVLDWVGLEMYKRSFELENTDWSTQPRLLHLLRKRIATVCWLWGEQTRCWHLENVDESHIIDAYGDSAELETRSGTTLTRW